MRAKLLAPSTGDAPICRLATAMMTAERPADLTMHGCRGGDGQDHPLAGESRSGCSPPPPECRRRILASGPDRRSPRRTRSVRGRRRSVSEAARLTVQARSSRRHPDGAGQCGTGAGAEGRDAAAVRKGASTRSIRLIATSGRWRRQRCDRDPEAGLRVQDGQGAADGAAFAGPEAVGGAGGADAGDAVRRAGAGAVAAVQAAAAVPHRRLTAGGARAGAGATARGEGGIAGRRPILQAVAPRGMGFYRRQRGLLRAGKA